MEQKVIKLKRLSDSLSEELHATGTLNLCIRKLFWDITVFLSEIRKLSIEGINVFILQSDRYRPFSWLMFKNTIKSKVSAIYSETHKTVEY